MAPLKEKKHPYIKAMEKKSGELEAQAVALEKKGVRNEQIVIYF